MSPSPTMMAPPLPNMHYTAALSELDIEASKIYTRRQLSPRRRSLDRDDLPEPAAGSVIKEAMAGHFQRHLEDEARKLSVISGISSPAAPVSHYRETSWFTEEFDREIEVPYLDVGSARAVAAPGGPSSSTLGTHGSATTIPRMSVASTRSSTSSGSAKSAAAADSATTASFDGAGNHEHRSIRWLDPLPSRPTSMHSSAEHVKPATAATKETPKYKPAKPWPRTRTRDSTKSPPPDARGKMPKQKQRMESKHKKHGKRAKLKRWAWVVVMMTTFCCS
jgi:hypothetical protein